MVLSEQTKGYVATIVVILIVGLSFLFVKKALLYSDMWNVLTHRFILAWVVMLPFAIYKRRELKITKDELPPLLLMASLYPVLIFISQIWGLKYITSAEAGIIQAVQPLLTMGMAVFLLKELVTSKQKLFALLSVFGVVFIFVMQGVNPEGNFWGYFLLLLSCVTLALYVILSRKYKVRFSVFKLTFFCITFGMLFFSILSLGLHNLSQEHAPGFFRAFRSMEYLGAILYLGILSSLLTLVLTNYSYARIEASKLGLFGNFVPVVVILAGVIVMGDRLSWVQMIGIILILTGVIGVNIPNKKQLP